jgi:hypothetical protein
MASSDDAPRVFQPLPGPTVNRSAAYRAVLRELLSLVGAEAPPDDARRWPDAARMAVRKAVKARTEQGPVPEEWFEPMMRATVHEPDPSFVGHLVLPAVAAWGLRPVMLALLDHLDNGTPADVAGVARAWYHTGWAPEAEHEDTRDLNRRYQHAALRRFVTLDDLDARRYLLPGLRLQHRSFPPDMHELVDQAVHIARTSDDDYLRHRVEIQTRLA